MHYCVAIANCVTCSPTQHASQGSFLVLVKTVWHKKETFIVLSLNPKKKVTKMTKTNKVTSLF